MVNSKSPEGFTRECGAQRVSSDGDPDQALSSDGDRLHDILKCSEPYLALLEETAAIHPAISQKRCFGEVVHMQAHK